MYITGDQVLGPSRAHVVNCSVALGIPRHALKQWYDHRVGGDVTGGYIDIDAERFARVGRRGSEQDD
ncbi:hypothetical protein [Roseovarius aestuarii]|uniref:hypothetical protein n=1 Tax=Roseovarius aestuarii TaxID=475083 RepID=UPI001CC14AB0|nr:hypothetical protein [Roseovarius aestuarii]